MTYLLAQASAHRIPLRDESVQTCVTSPPYWGLRAYAGEQGVKWSDSTTHPLGLEPTPDLFVAHMVEVFREVWRVLRKDGTLWLNLGSSYFGGGNGGGGSFASERPGWSVFGGNDPTRSPARERVPAYDTDGIERSGSLGAGSAYPGLCDGCRVVLSSRTVHSGRQTPGLLSPQMQKGRGNEPRGSAPASPGASHRVSQVSMQPESSPPPQGECSHCGNCGVCLSVLRSSTRDAQACARTAAYRRGNAQLASGDHNQSKDASGMAWLNYTFKPKDLVPIPWRVALALQADGWYLRSDIIWSKPKPMPESVTDRPTKAHEYVFLMSKSERYYYDADAVREAARYGYSVTTGEGFISAGGDRGSRTVAAGNGGDRNMRTVWQIATQPYPGAHFATFPEALPERCIKAGSVAGGVVLDPFNGSGTTGRVALSLGRRYVGLDMSREYLTEQAIARIDPITHTHRTTDQMALPL